MKRKKLAVVGPGLIGKKHIELIRSHGECELAAIVAPDHPPHHVLARELQVPLFHDLASLFRLQAVDGVMIASPNVFHVEQAIVCIEAGVPVFIEKPITHTVEAGERLVALVESKSAKVLVGHHRAHSPILAGARKAIQEGKLGRIVGIMGSALFYKPKEYFEAGPWRTQIGGGPILINLIHEVGNFRSLGGEIVAVQAMSSSSTRGFAVEDTVAINFQFENGALGTFLLSDCAASARSWEQTSRENVTYPSYSDEDCYLVAGTMGSLAVPTMRLKSYEREEDQSWWKPFKQETLDIVRVDPLACQLDHFLRVIDGVETPLVSAKDGLRNLKITEAIADSAKTKSLVYTT
jgi:predicted dehydrogenase